MPENQRVDVCIICALEEEANAAEQVISERCKAIFVTCVTRESHLSYRATTIPNNKGEPLILALFCQTRPGLASAAFDLGTLLQVFQPCFLGMSGICAGDKRYVQLGDLVVAEHAYHCEEGKIIRDEQGEVIVLSEGITYGPTSHVLQYARTFETWKTPVAELKKDLFGTDESPRCTIRLMASGMAVHSDNPFEDLQKRHRKTWALDMEAASLYFALHNKPFVNGLVVKGVVDYADHSKDDTFHDFAARASAIYLLTFIQEYVTTNALLQRPSPSVFTVPYPPNAYFTGREELLTQIHRRFQLEQESTTSQPQALSGLGGIGKTQIAIEYAYRHRQDYQAILWVRADTQEALVSGFVTLMKLLDLPEKDERDQATIFQAVRRWLTTHTGWLLILDNADDPSLVQSCLPSEHRGHILLTTRAHALGSLAKRVVVEIMSQEVGTLFLVRRAGLIGRDAHLEAISASERGIASQITEELGGLPLALDQAGAFIEETECGLASYLRVYQQRRIELLKRRGDFPLDYHFSVATAWRLSFEKVKLQSSTAVDLLRCCAFLHPDAIPEELFTNGAIHLGSRLQQVSYDILAFNEAVRILLAYSLLSRNPATTTLSIHRLVQAVLVDAMLVKTRNQWRGRIMHALNAAFPEVAFKEWTKCERLLPHVLVSATWIGNEPIPLLEAAHLLRKTGIYLQERGQYKEAKPLLEQALSICKQQLGETHPDTAMNLNNLAELYNKQGRYKLAEPLHLRALSIREQQLGETHSDTAASLNNLALLYYQQGKYELAEPLYLRALSIRKQQLGETHPDTAASLNNLALLYYQQGKYELAEPLHQQALSIRKQQLGETHPDTAMNLNNLAVLHYQQGKYELAEPLHQQALSIREQQLGKTHPDTATSLNNLAELYRQQGKYQQAEYLHQRALSIREQQLGETHPDTATSLNNLAELYEAQGKYQQAEPLHQQALSIREQQLGETHPDVAMSLNNLANLYYQQREYELAEPLYLRAHSIWEQQLGETHSLTATSLNNLAELYRQQGKYKLAEPLYQRALSIWEQQLGETHPLIAHPIHGLAELYQRQRKYKQAEILYRRALAIRQQRLEPTHPKTQETRKAYATLLRILGRNDEAAALDTTPSDLV